MKSKPELRQTYRHLLGGEVGVETRARLTDRLNDRIINFVRQHPGTWASYQPSGFEPDLRGAMAKVQSVEWVFPRVMGEHIQFFHPHSNASFSLSKWGILEPEPSQSRAVALGELKGLLIPGLAFDSSCNRLGRGGGYYDRALAELSPINPHALKIGVAFDLQVSNETFPSESFDVPMDFVVTDSRLLERPRPERKTS